MRYLSQYMEHLYHSTDISPHPIYGREYETSLSQKDLVVCVSHVFNALFVQYCHILPENIQNDLSEAIYGTFLSFHCQ